MEEGWCWWWRWIPLSGAQNKLQISPPGEDQEVAAAPYRETRWTLLPYFFLPESEYIELELRSVEVQGAHKVGGRALVGWARPPPLWPGCGPPSIDSFANIFYIFQNLSPWIFRSIRELFILHKNNTMAILLKTASVRVSSIQIMQVRVQNKGKRVWKSRYDEDVSTPTSLTYCLSSSNSVDKLKVIRKTFTNSVWSCCCKYVKPAFKFSAKIMN